MRLINTATYELAEFFEDEVPPYAILSHTWERNEEVSFQDIQNLDLAKQKRGFIKIQYCCKQATKHFLDWVWIDTCCINKESSAELSEAINSMFRWYKKAVLCYAYLADIGVKTGRLDIALSRWFTRGWTLQELIAPDNVFLYDGSWNLLGGKNELCEVISNITGIESTVLSGKRTLASVCIAKRMFWASKRKTTRTEDLAYSLLGIFNATMPLLYGEGAKAFTRLQVVIMSQSEDHTLFAWKAPPPSFSRKGDPCGLLASSPADFGDSSNITPLYIPDLASPYSMTNRGLQIKLPQLPADPIHGTSTTLLACRDNSHPHSLVAVQLGSIGQQDDMFHRVKSHQLSYISAKQLHQASVNTIYVKEEDAHHESSKSTMECWTTIRNLPAFFASKGQPVCELHAVHPPELWHEELRGLGLSPDVKAGALFVQGNLPSFVLVLGMVNSELWCNLLPILGNETLEEVVERSEDQHFKIYNNDLVMVKITTQWTLGLKNFVIDISDLWD
jgi:hypothetical protein